MDPPVLSPLTLQWWHRRLGTYLRQQADVIRNDPLQDLLALRRSLEFSLRQERSPTAPQTQIWLQQLDQLYKKLEHLCDRISPPQWDDLALALQHRLHLWQSQHPQVVVTGEYQAVVGDARDNNIILWVLEEWLRIISDASPQVLPAQTFPTPHVQVQLRPIGDRGELLLQAPPVSSLKQLSEQARWELMSLGQIFPQLMWESDGQMSLIESDRQGLSCILHWSLESSSLLE